MSLLAVRECRVDVGGAELWVARSGSGPALALGSGGPGCCDYLEPVARLIDDRVEVIRFEQRGCGRSDPAPSYDLHTCVQDLDRIRSAFGLRRWMVGGHSWGANLALAWALEHPERTDAVLYIAGNGVQNDRDWHECYQRARDGRGEREPDYAFAPNREVNRQLNASWQHFVREPKLWRRIATLDVPVLVVIAQQDIRPAWPAEQLAAALPRAQLVRIESAEHAIWLSHADELRDVLRDFLRAAPGR